MKPYDPDKMRRLDPALASKVEEAMARKAEDKARAEKAAEALCDAPSPSEPPRPPLSFHSAPGDAPGRPEPPSRSRRPAEADEGGCEAPQRPRGIEGFQEPLLAPEAMEIDGQGDLFGGGGSVAPAPDDRSEESEVDALVSKLQGSLALEGVPDCKRSAEELSLLTWRDKSTRREDEAFEHPPEFDDELRAMPDKKLAEAWGWLTKRRYRGLSERDQAVQREVYARSFGMPDLYGLGRQPAVSAMLEDVLRSQGCRSGVALYIASLLEKMIQQGRMALRLSAADARVLKGCAASTWWAAVAQLEGMGILERVHTAKPGEYGSAPVQRSTNLYVLGPWWFEGSTPGTTPLAELGGLMDKCTRQKDSRAARAALRKTRSARKARRRAVNARNRDRNRRRHHALPPKVTSTREVERVTEVLAREHEEATKAAALHDSRKRAQALMEGNLEAARAGLGETTPPEVQAPSSEALEAAAVAQVQAVNRGEPGGDGLRLELVRARTGIRVARRASVPLGNCRPVSERQSRRGRREEEFNPIETPPLPSLTYPKPPTPIPKTPRSNVGDKPSCSKTSLGDRARALDGSAKLDPTSLELWRHRHDRGRKVPDHIDEAIFQDRIARAYEAFLGPDPRSS